MAHLWSFDPSADRLPAEVLQALCDSRRAVVFGGAGLSAESGIATFRDALTGALWSRFDAAQLATPEAFLDDPALVWGWYEWRRMNALLAEPNPAHRAIAALERRLPALSVITQNVDDLHERAGSHEVLHLHGSLHRPRCFDCGRPHPLDRVPDEPEGGRRLEPPRCTHCGGHIRPGVVWFGEALPERALRQAFDAAGGCDLFFSVGTSGLVQPAAQLPAVARAAGARVVHVNPHRPEGVAPGDWCLLGPAGEVLPRLLRQAGLG